MCVLINRLKTKMSVEELENDFINVCSMCLENDDLVNEFCRLKKIKRPDKRSPIERQIDNARGYDAGIVEWKNLSNEAKGIIEWVVSPFTNMRETIEIKIGSIFYKRCPKLYIDYEKPLDSELNLIKLVYCLFRSD